ncbi:hypothetical protein CVS54_01377 [Microbacterium oxydans]|uniref:Uncharacterized protein n=1 Tax=Microbacterium oxydans TaxID=82380 RepID=A0A3Q9J4P0_9MICO|nr:MULTISPECIES: hypothetical protein [Microbacterium]AZS40055.1 hypothetical protein CVS54_01377 [Microbacterium oxydans]
MSIRIQYTDPNTEATITIESEYTDTAIEQAKAMGVPLSTKEQSA